MSKKESALELKVTSIKDGKVRFKIIKQSVRNSEFNAGSNVFIAKNRLRLLSIGSPQCDFENNTLYVRGRTEYKDNKILICTELQFKKVKRAVTEYNTSIATYVKKRNWFKDKMTLERSGNRIYFRGPNLKTYIFCIEGFKDTTGFTIAPDELAIVTIEKIKRGKNIDV